MIKRRSSRWRTRYGRPRPKLDPRLAALLAIPVRELRRLHADGHQRREKHVASDAGPGGIVALAPAPVTAGVFLPTKAKPHGPAAFDEPYVSAFLDCDASMDDLRRLGVRPRARSGDIVTAFIPVSLIPRLERSPAVRCIELARPLTPGVEQAVAYAGMDRLHNETPPLKGQGVIIGVVDILLDFYHPDLRRSDGTTRVLWLWDEALAPQAGERRPAGFTYGVAYDAAAIDTELSHPVGIAPYQIVRHATYPASHGTQVAGLAVGNGLADPAAAHVGAAPEADLIFVSVTSTGGPSFADSAGVADGVSYAFARAAELGRPCVVNVSLYDNQGPHDGTSLGERFIDGLLATPGRAVTLITGNSQLDRVHASGDVRTGETAPLALHYDPPTATASHKSDTAEIWYDAHDRLSVTVRAPDGTSIGPIAPGSGLTAVTLAGGVTVRVTSIVGDQRNGDNVIALMLTVPFGALLTGDWMLELAGDTILNGHFEAFLDRANSPQSRWLAPYVLGTRLTLGHPSACRRAIVVGNHRKDGPPPTVHPTSGRGPTRDGRLKPDICAVGTALATLRGRDMRLADPGAFYVTGNGTSMAAPLVAGACALLFECRGAEATCADLKQIIQDLAGVPSGTFPNPWMGFGYLQVAEACAAAPPKVDVWLRDNEQDVGLEPATGVCWLSPDIGILDSAGNPMPNPIHDPSRRFTTIVRVTVRNRGTQTARNVEVYLYWADPATYIPFPTAWNSSGIFAGGQTFQAVTNRIVVQQVPAGGATTIDFAWAPPAPGANLRGDDHFCLLARLEHDLDPSNVDAGGFVAIPVRNNLGLRNVHVLPNSTGGDAVSSFHVVGTGDEDGLWVRPLLKSGIVTLNMPVSALPWRELALIEKHGPRAAHGCACAPDPLARRNGRVSAKEIEDRTGIRGAAGMLLADGIATIELRGDVDLEIPQLRLLEGARLPVSVAVTGIRTAAERRFVHVGQRSGGRTVGGVTLELRKGLPHRKRTADRRSRP